MLKRLVKLLPLFLALLLVAGFSAQADDASRGVANGAFAGALRSQAQEAIDATSGCGGNAPGMTNPAAEYCHELGYEYQIVDTAGGQYGICILPDGSRCNGWSFLQGKCGQSYSYCARQGYDLVTKRDGRNAFSREYGVCVRDQREVGAATDLMGLSEKATKGAFPAPRSPGPPEGGGSTVGSPPSFDWRDYNGQNWMTSVKNQGSCGSCWAFSVVGVVEAIYNIGTGNPNLDLDLSEQQLVSNGSPCCGVCGDCDGGWPSKALAYIGDTGIADEDCFPYTATTAYCALCADWQAGAVTVDETGYVAPSLIKAKVVDTGPLTVAMGIGPYYGGGFDGDGIYRCTNPNGPGANHAVIIAGYNDTGGYWIVKNSWGTGWPSGWFNDDGYFKVGYGECAIEQYVLYADVEIDGDGDGDGILDSLDNCPETYNSGQDDYDDDGVPGTQPPPGATWGGDACDDDDDNDTVLDGDDADPLDEFACQDLDEDTCDDCSVLGQPDVSQDGTDADSDGICDAGDADPLDEFACQDLDEDTCDDCALTGGPPDPSGDGTDTDSDGLCDAGDPDDDSDGFDDPIEQYVGTDPLDDCTDQPGDNDAWPLDMNMDGAITVSGDVLNYRDRIGATPGDPDWWQRLDFDMNDVITVSGDVLAYRGMIGETCT